MTDADDVGFTACYRRHVRRCFGARTPEHDELFATRTLEHKAIRWACEIRCERAYNGCGHCGHGLFPWDQTVDLTPRCLTPGAECVVSMVGLLNDSFSGVAANVLPEWAGLHLGESTAECTTEGAGTRLGERLAERRTFDPRVSWAWHADAQGRTCA